MDFSKVKSKVGFLGYIDRPYPDGSSERNATKWIVAAVVLILIAINSVRMFDNNFWSDELYSIGVAHMSFTEIIDYSKDIDSHPPLYNLMLAAMCAIFGANPVTYHVTSMIPYVGMLILGSTVIRRWFGTYAAVIFMLLCTVLEASMYNIPEVRMYELGAFLVLASYLSFYSVLRHEGNKEYALFVITSLLAAYTHYYCLLAVGLLYIVLIAKFFIGRDWPGFKRFFVFGVITVIGYLPWLLTSLLHRVEYNTGKFWITICPNFRECLEYMFAGPYDKYLLLASLILIAVFCIRKVKRSAGDSKSKLKHLFKFDANGIWVVGGLFSIVGSIAFGEIISALTTPLLILRYLYPVSIIAWLLFAVAISRMDCLKVKNLIPVITVVVIVLIGAPYFCQTVDTEFKDNQSTIDIIACVNDNTEDGDTLLTDLYHMKLTMGAYYYPNLNTVYFEDNILPDLDPNVHYILYLDSANTTDFPEILESLELQLAEKGYKAVYLTGGSFASFYTVSVYDIVPIS